MTQETFDTRLLAVGPDVRMRTHDAMYRDAFRLVWAQVDRAPAMTPLETARFVLRRLYPDLEGPRLESIMNRLTEAYAAGTWTGFERPSR